MAVACERPLPEAVLSLLEEHWEGPPTPALEAPGAEARAAPVACRHAIREIQPVPAARTLFPLRPRLQFPLRACFRLRAHGSPSPATDSASHGAEPRAVSEADRTGPRLSQGERGMEGGEGGDNEGRNEEEGHPGGGAEGCSGDSLLDLPLGNDLLTQIFLHLSPRDLCRASLVSTRWRDVAGDPGLHVQCFQQRWGLAAVRGSPLRPAFWLLEKPPFAIRHVLRPSDTVTAVAVQYGCQTVVIQRMNNMMNEHAIHTRTQLLIPLCLDVVHHCLALAAAQRQEQGDQNQSPNQRTVAARWPLRGAGGDQARGPAGGPQGALQGVQAVGGVDRQRGQQGGGLAGHVQGQGQAREPVQGQAQGQAQGQGQGQGQGQAAQQEKAMLLEWLKGKVAAIEYDRFARRDVVVVLDPIAAGGESEDAGEASEASEARAAAKRAEARARVVQMFMKAFGIDELTATYYLEEANGDVRAASVLLRRDLEWERRQHTGGGR